MAIPWLCLVILPVASQVVHQWTSQRGGEKEDKARALQVDANGSAWVAGYTESSLDGHTNAGGRDIFLMKFDAQGVHQWTRQRGGERDDFAYGLQVDDVGNALVAGSTLSSLDGHTNAGESDIFLMKFDAQGVHLWTRQRGGAGSDWATALQVDANGSAWVAGFTDSSLDGHTNAGDADVFLMKFDAQGLHQWTRQRGDQWDDKAKSLQVDAKGNAWVAGETKLEEFAFFAGARPQLDVFLMKFDAQGVHQWTRVRWGYGDDKARALQVDAEGDAWVAGYTDSSRLDGHDNAGGRDVFLMKFNAQGVHQWTRVHGGKGSDMAQALQVDDVGNAWVAGCTWTSFLDSEPRAYDLFLMKFDVQGVHQWTSQRGGQGWDEAQALQDKLLGGAGLGLAPGCTGHDLSKCSCSDLKALISAPHCPVDQSACLTAGNCPAGCPNLAAQVVTWLASVNAKAKNVKFSTLSFDGEDGGESATAWALCQFKLLGDELGIPEVGMAKSIAAGPQSPGVTYTMPETYWYMGELWPCTGDQWQLKEKPPVCTTQSSYRSFVDKAWPFLNWLNISDKVMQEKPGFPSLIDNIRWVKTNAPGKAVIPMFSFEGLSLKSCFATHFSAGVKNVSDICGTFDGFSFWQWETFKEFMIYFADAFQVDEVGIYDLQFIPPYWFDNKAFGPNDDCKASAR